MDAMDRAVATAVLQLYRASGGVTPTTRQIGAAIGVKGPGAALARVRRAVSHGAIRTVGGHRTARYLPAVDGECPLCGSRVSTHVTLTAAG